MKESPHKEAKKIDLSDFTDAQKEAVKHRGANLLVSAGAGTGKTRVLVARFVHLVVEDKIDVDSILSVTFTEKAADEMKERIARSFEKLSMTAQKHAVGNAHIGTIHGFCTKILRENPFAAGIDPEFEVMSEIDQVILMEEVFNELLEEGNEDLIGLVDNLDEIKLKTGLRAYVDLNRCLGRKPDRINVLIKKPEVLVESLRMEANSCLLGIQKEAAEKAQMLKNLSCSGQIEEHRKAIIALLKGVGDNTNDTSALSSVLDYFSRIRLSGGRADDSDREEIVEILKAIRDFVRGKDNCNVLLLRSGPEALQQDIEKNIIPFLRIAYLFWVRYNEKKRDAGRLDYEDLQLKTRDLFQNVPSVRDEYRQRFMHILVDEFQDINTLQKEILELLKPKNGFFIVGDIRQSIYGFRNAEVEIMKGYRRDCNKGEGKCIELNENFRSSSNILKFINTFFTSLWGESENQPLISKRKEGDAPIGRPNVEMILLQGRSANGNLDKVDPEKLKELEADAVAARINEMIRECYQILDKETGKWRPVSYADIAILVHTRSTYNHYAKIFSRNGIPFSMHQSRDLFDQREIQDILAFLSIIDNGRNDIDMAAVLRSPFCDISDDTLVAVRKCAENESIDSPYLLETLRKIVRNDYLDEDSRRKIGSFVSLFDRLRSIKDVLSLGCIFDMIMENTEYETRTLTLWGGQRRLENLLKMREIMAVYGRKERKSINGFIEYCRDIEQWGLMEEAEQDTGEEDKIRFITIHGAKGLEFPVVVLADLGKQYNLSSESIMVSDKLEVGFSTAEEADDSSAMRKKLISNAKRKSELEEHKRLLYVAMTRARDCLIFAGISQDRKNESPLRTLHEHFISNIPSDLLSKGMVQYGNSRVLIYKPEMLEKQESEKGKPFLNSLEQIVENGNTAVSINMNGCGDVEQSVNEAVEFISGIENMNAVGIPDHIPVTDLMIFDECPRKYFLLRMLHLPDVKFHTMSIPDAASGLDAAGIGAIVHQMLERVDYAANADSEIRRLVKPLYLLEKDEDRISSLMRKFLGSNLARDIKCSGKVLREIPFTLFISAIPVHGRADLIYQTGNGGMCLVDFKTNNIKPEDVDAVKSQYNLQMELYGLALSCVEGMDVREGMAYFIAPGRAAKYSFLPETLEKCREKTIEIIGRIAKRDFPLNRPAICRECEYFNLYCRHFPDVK